MRPSTTRLAIDPPSTQPPRFLYSGEAKGFTWPAGHSNKTIGKSQLEDNYQVSDTNQDEMILGTDGSDGESRILSISGYPAK